MGFKDDVRAKAVELEERVTALENLARQLRVSNGVTSVPVRPEVTRDVTGTAVRTPSTTGVDTEALAFGLSEIKREIKSQFGVTDAQLRSKWEGTVQYFADVLGKADSQFDAESFKRQAGV